MYNVRWLKYPDDLLDDKLEDLLNLMNAQGYEFVSLHHFPDAQQTCVIFKATTMGQFKRMTLS